MRRGGRRGLGAGILAALVAFAPASTRAEPALPESVDLAVEARVEGRDGNQLAATLRALVGLALRRDLGGWIGLGESGTGGAHARIVVEGNSGALTARTSYSAAGGSPRSVVSHASALDLLPPVLAGDLLALWAGDRPQDTFPLAPAPTHLLTVGTAALRPLAPAAVEPEVTDIAWGPDGLVLALPGGPVSVDPLFRITPETARDLLQARDSPLSAPLTRLQAPLTGGTLALLGDQRTLLLRDPTTGDTSSIEASGGPFDGLVAMPWGGFALWRASGGEPATDVLLGRRMATRIATASYRVAPALVTAAGADYDGNLWLFDAVERRIRIFDRNGREIHAIRPLVDRSVLPLPRQIHVYPDGSFLLGGSGEVWKLESSGVPIWRLASLGAEGQRALPGSFRFALHGARGSFALLDPEAREIHLFLDRPVGDGASDPESVLAQLLRGARGAIGAAEWCLDNDMSILASAILSSLPVTASRDATLLRRRIDQALAADIAASTAAYARRLEAALQLDRAEPAYAEAIEGYRSLRTAYPSSGEYAPLLEELTSRRLALRDTLLGFLDTDVVATVPPLHGVLAAAGGPILSLRLHPSPGGSAPRALEGVTAELGALRTIAPVTFRVGDLAAEREAHIPLSMAADAGLVEEDIPLTLGLRLSGTVAGEVVSSVHAVSALLSSRLCFDERWYGSSPPRSQYLAWLAASPDPCVRGFREAVLDLTGADTTRGSPVENAALVFGLLADAIGSESPLMPGETQLPRQTAQSLRGTGEDTLLLAASWLEGLDRAFLTVGPEAYLLIDTGIPADSLGPGAAILAALSRAAHRTTVILPLAAPRREPTAGALEGALRRAEEELAAVGLTEAHASLVSGTGTPIRSPHLPAYALPLEDLRARAQADARAVAAYLGH